MNPSFHYKNKVWALQPPNVAEVFETLFKSCKPDLIIEIGTKHGGLTTVLCEFCPTAEIHTYDITDEHRSVERATFHKQNVFEAESEMAAMIGRKKTCSMVVCDGGNKVKEFQTFAKYLKKGDFILAHDFDPNTCEGWVWKEISEADIAETVSQYKLSPFQKTLMATAAWCCYKKG